jgi:hypothetical protein
MGHVVDNYQAYNKEEGVLLICIIHSKFVNVFMNGIKQILCNLYTQRKYK